MGDNVWLWIPPTEDAERFGTVINEENGWSLVDPFNEKMTQRALVAGARSIPAAHLQ